MSPQAEATNEGTGEDLVFAGLRMRKVASFTLQQLTNSLLLPDNYDDKYKGQNRPDDDKDPDVDFLVGDSKYICPVHQHSHTPVENLVHHFLPPEEYFELSWSL